LAGPPIFAEATGCVDTPVYGRYRLAPGTRCDGPAINEERDYERNGEPRSLRYSIVDD
jgi:N-methylhydantoinase A/oxoprolinase/acetone carboxylase beta subunit